MAATKSNPNSYPKRRIRPQDIVRLQKLKARLNLRSEWAAIKWLLDQHERAAK